MPNQFGDINLNLNGYHLNGVTDFSYTQSQNASPIKFMGGTTTQYEFPESSQNQLSYSQYSFFDDPIFGYAKSGTIINGGIYREQASTLFKSGIVTQYSISARVGDFPKTSASINILGVFSTGEPDSFPYSKKNYPAPSIVYPHRISVSGISDETYNIVDFSYSLSIPLSTTSYVGQFGIKDFTISRPLPVEMTYTVNTSDYRTKGFLEYNSSNETKNISIIFKDCNGDLVSSYSLTSGVLVGEQVASSTSSDETISFTYRGFLNDL